MIQDTSKHKSRNMPRIPLTKTNSFSNIFASTGISCILAISDLSFLRAVSLKIRVNRKRSSNFVLSKVFTLSRCARFTLHQKRKHVSVSSEYITDDHTCMNTRCSTHQREMTHVPQRPNTCFPGFRAKADRSKKVFHMTKHEFQLFNKISICCFHLWCDGVK